jgi:NAD-dependent dihydropyrimidine dehydrogenase PreA subunit
MCDFCASHGHGKKWYLNARNYAKELATSQYVKEFCESYFGREVKPGNPNEPKSVLQKANIPTPEEVAKVDFRYRKFLHHQVISTAETLEILQLAGQTTEDHEATVVLLPCICRYRIQGSDPDLHCFGIAFTSEYTKRFPRYCGGGYRYISTEAAYEILERMITEEPIVHAISALGVPYLGMLCNCDMNVCSPYFSRIQFEITSPFYKAHHRAKVDSQKCVGCGTCQESCPFDVAKVNPNTNLADIDLKACFGCEICIRNCPEEAISLIGVDESIGY